MKLKKLMKYVCFNQKVFLKIALPAEKGLEIIGTISFYDKNSYLPEYDNYIVLEERVETEVLDSDEAAIVIHVCNPEHIK